MVLNKIKNPLTGRFVLKTGRVGKSILKERKQKRDAKRQEKIAKKLINRLEQIEQIETKKKNIKMTKNEIAKLSEDIKNVIGIQTNLLNNDVDNFDIGSFENETKARYNLMTNGSIKAGFELSKYGGLEQKEVKKMMGLLDVMSIKGNVLFIITLDDAMKTEKYFTLNKQNRDQIIRILSNGGLYDANYAGHGSDVIVEAFGSGVYNIRVEQISDNKKSLFGKRSDSALFFKRINTSIIDLSKYQIIRKSDPIELIDEHCLIYAFRKLNIPEKYIMSVTSHFETGAYIAKASLHEIAKIIKRNIIVRQYARDTGNKSGISQKKQNFKVNEEYETIELCIYDDHYFVYEKMDITEYAIKNYEKLKNIENFKNINKILIKNGKPYYTRTSTGMADNLFVIRQLDLQGYFKDDETLKKTAMATTTENKISLENIENEQKLYEYKPKEDEEATIFFADTETDTSEEHTPLMIGCAKMRDENTLWSVRIFERSDSLHNMVCRFLDYVIQQSKTEKIYVYFHNLKYDLMVLLANIYLMDSPCEKDGQIYSVKVLYKKRIIEFRDTYKLIPCALSEFCETFKLPEDLKKKEYIGYGYYRTSNQPQDKEDKQTKHDKENVKIGEYIKHLKDKDIIPFMKLITEDDGLLFGYDHDKKTFKAWDYYKHYLRYDVFVLMEGMRVFKNSINQMTEGKMNLFNYLTISSLTYSFFSCKGSFDGMYSVTGQLRDFIGESVKGGRVCANTKYERKVIVGKTSDYDSVSCYSSSIVRLCKEWGFAKGKCKKLNSMSELKEDYYYIIKIRINKINKHQQMPFVSYKDTEGILQYTNDIPKCGYIETTVDRYTLEDWVLFQGIEYEFITGIYWDQGYNQEMGKFTQNLFDDRLRYKSEKNDAMQGVIKLMLNSSFGRTMIKKTTIKKELIRDCHDKNNKKYGEIKENYYNRINKKFHVIKSIEKLNDNQSQLVMTHYDDTYNLAFVGCAILSYSKRIMNEVFNVANDLKIPIYYTDTDSMHLPLEGIKPIENEFRNRYGKELNGKQLGQFHTDFKIEVDEDDKVLKKQKEEDIERRFKGCEIYAPRSLVLGKKTYIDELVRINKDGEKLTGLHYRMKGMTQEGIIHEADKNHGGDIFKLYEHLANHPTLMTLNPKGKFMIEYKNKRAITRADGKFTRTVDFRSKEEKLKN
jgi:hypothetical protein